MKENLGERIKHYRERKKLSQVALALALKVDKQTVWRWEDGRSWPEYPVLEVMAKELDIKVENLFENITGPPVEPSDEALLEMLAKRLKSIEKLSTPKQDLIKLIESAAFDDAKAEKYLALFGFNDSGNPPVKSVSNPGKMKSRIS